MSDARTILLLAAEAREFSGLMRFCRDVKRLDWPVEWAKVGRLNGYRVWMAANGAGGLRAAAAMDAIRSREPVHAVASIGFCGALDPALRLGDIFVASSIRSRDGAYQACMLESRRPFYSGVLASIDHVAQTVEEKQRLLACGASALDMESGEVAARAREWGLPLFCVRVVTDLPEEGFTFDFNAAREADGRFNRARIVAHAMRHPIVLMPELFRLAARSRMAARMLGEFIASARF